MKVTEAEIEQQRKLQEGNYRSNMSKGFGKIHDGIRQIRSSAEGIGLTPEALEHFVIMDTIFLKSLRALRLMYGIPYEGPIQEPTYAPRVPDE